MLLIQRWSHPISYICIPIYSLYSLVTVVPLHTQWLAAIGRLQKLELEQDGLVQVSAHKRLVVEDRDTDHRGVHYRVSGKPEGGREIAQLPYRKTEEKFHVLVRTENNGKDKVSREEQDWYTKWGLNVSLLTPTGNWTVCYFVIKPVGSVGQVTSKM